MKYSIILLLTALLCVTQLSCGKDPAPVATAGANEKGIATPKAERLQPSGDPAILGTWKMHPDFVGSLGASELIMRKNGSTGVPEFSIVITPDMIRHRFNLPDGMAIFPQAGQKAELVKSPEGTNYLVIDYKYSVNTKASPNEIDFLWTTPEGKAAVARGIYKLETNSLWLAVNILGNTNRPTDFVRENHSFSKSVIKADKQ